MASRKVLEMNGNLFESRVVRVLQESEQDATVLHNVSVFSKFLEKDTQIDAILVHRKGLIVVEAKNWTDVVKGGYNDRVWISSSNNGGPITTYSPIDQNFIHMRALRNAFRQVKYYPPEMHSVIVFPDGARIESNCDEVCTLSQLPVRVRQILRESDRNYNIELCMSLLRKIARF